MNPLGIVSGVLRSWVGPASVGRRIALLSILPALALGFVGTIYLHGQNSSAKAVAESEMLVDFAAKAREISTEALHLRLKASAYLRQPSNQTEQAFQKSCEFIREASGSVETQAKASGFGLQFQAAQAALEHFIG